jgi:predicted phosphoribosyltransferase
MKLPFRDRFEAGRFLAERVQKYVGRDDVRVLALPRGGMPVGFELAKVLHAPLDVFVVRKLGVPGHEELAMGAIASGGVIVLNEDVLQLLRMPPQMLDFVIAREKEELERRERLYRDGRPPVDVRQRVVILVDDGLATGATMRAAVAALRKREPKRIIVAVPVAAGQTCDELSGEVDEIVCGVTPEPFHAVGVWYQDFSQTTDEEVQELLRRAAQIQPPDAAAGEPASRAIRPA